MSSFIQVKDHHNLSLCQHSQKSPCQVQHAQRGYSDKSANSLAKLKHFLSICSEKFEEQRTRKSKTTFLILLIEDAPPHLERFYVLGNGPAFRIWEAPIFQHGQSLAKNITRSPFEGFQLAAMLDLPWCMFSKKLRV